MHSGELSMHDVQFTVDSTPNTVDTVGNEKCTKHSLQYYTQCIVLKVRVSVVTI